MSEDYKNEGVCEGCHEEVDERCNDGYCRDCHVSLEFEECVDGSWVDAMRAEAGMPPSSKA